MSLPLLQSLIAVFGIGVLCWAIRSALAAAALVGNLLTCVLISDAIHNGLSPTVLASIDVATAALLFIIIDPDKRWQVLLPASYVFGLGCHAVYSAFGPSIISPSQYWWALYYMAWGQVCFVAIWTSLDSYRVLRSGSHPLRRLYACRHLLRSRLSGDAK